MKRKLAPIKLKLKVDQKKKQPKYDWSMLPEKEKTAVKEKSLKWLGENYEMNQLCSLQRKNVYRHYLDFCEKEGIALAPLESTFGRYVIHQFPLVRMRRIGKRNCTSYHYAGIDIKSTSDGHSIVLPGSIDSKQTLKGDCKAGPDSGANETR